MKKLFLRIFFTITATLGVSAIARAQGFGDMAENLMGSVVFASNFIYSICFVLGASFLFAAIVKYIEHRRSPLMVPISTVVFFIVAGIILILLPFAHLLLEHGTSFTLLNLNY